MSPNKKGVCFERSMYHENCCYPPRTEIRWNRELRFILETARDYRKVSAKLVVRARTLAWECPVVEGRLWRGGHPKSSS